jgi:hypothetical protein
MKTRTKAWQPRIPWPSREEWEESCTDFSDYFGLYPQGCLREYGPEMRG